MAIGAVGSTFPQFTRNAPPQGRKSAGDGAALSGVQESAGKQSRTTPPILQQDLQIGRYSRVSVESFMESLKRYDNRDAVLAAQESIDKNLYSLFGMKFDKDTAFKVESEEPIIFLENVSFAEIQRQKIDNWLAGEGAFDSKMLGEVSSNGFRVVGGRDKETQTLLDEFMNLRPKTEEEIARGKELAKQIAGLTPEDFEWWEAHGLQALTLEEREEFRSGMGDLLQSTLNVDMHEIGFSFKPSGDILSINTKRLSDAEKNEFIEMFNNRDSSRETNALITRLKELGARNAEIYIDRTV